MYQNDKKIIKLLYKMHKIKNEIELNVEKTNKIEVIVQRTCMQIENAGKYQERWKGISDEKE